MTELTTKTLDQIARIKGGKRLPKGKQLTTVATDHPYIRAQDIRNNRIVLTEPNYITDDIYEKIKRYTVSQDDVVLTIVGAGIGEIGIIPRNLEGANLTENAVKLTDLKEFDPQFLFYSLLDEKAQGQIYNLAAGAAQPKIGIYKVKQIEVPAPSLVTQQKISSILSAFDNLIENNTRRIAILEEMARLIYREWFVHYKYPGYENDKMVDSETELGDVPEGWGVKNLEKVIDLVYGIGLRKKDRIDGPYPVYGSSGIIDWHIEYHKEGPGIIVGRKGNVGSVFWEFENFNPIDTTYFVESDLPLTYVYYNLQNQNFINNDSAVPGLSKRQANSLPVLIPDDTTLQKFDIEIIKIFNLIKNLNDQNDKLKATRDLLLPKLISGDLNLH